jgi:hypothetical protein
MHAALKEFAYDAALSECGASSAPGGSQTAAACIDLLKEMSSGGAMPAFI